MNCTVGDVITNTLSVSPANTSLDAVEYTSSDETIAQVDAKSGEVKAIAEGTATITVTLGDATASYKVKVAAKPADVVSVEKVVISTDSLSMKIGDTETITASVLPANATDSSITWSVEGDGCISVTDGKIVAVKAGTAIVTATASNGVYATCIVTVQEDNVPVQVSVSLPATDSMTVGEEKVLSPVIVNGTGQTVTWNTDNEDVVSVEQDGTVKAVGKGTATVTITVGSASATCYITVTEKPEEEILVQKITIADTLNLTKGSVFVLDAVVTPLNATNRELVWSTTDSTVVRVDEGKLTACSAGVVVVSVATVDGSVRANCIVTVTEADTSVDKVPVTGITLYDYADKTLTLSLGEEYQLMYEITPSNATNKEVCWGVNNPEVVEIDQTGYLKAVGAGDCYVYVKTIDGSFSSICHIVVEGNGSSTGTTQNPSGTNQNPTGTTQTPTGTNQNPTGTTQSPTGTNQNPTGTTQDSTGTNQNPTGTTQTPTGTNQNPSGTTQTPAGTDQNQSGTTQTPAGTTQNPTGTNQSGTTQTPAGTTQNSAATVSLNKTVNMKVNATKTICVTELLNLKSGEHNISFTSSDESVVAIGFQTADTGYVSITSKKPGIATITAVDKANNNATLTIKVVVKPSKVKGIKATASKKSIKLQWKAVKGASKYRVYIYKNKKYKLVKTTSKRSVVVKKLKSKKKYKFKLVAITKSGGETIVSPSAVKTAKTK